MSLLVKLKRQIVVLLILPTTLKELHYKSNRTNKDIQINFVVVGESCRQNEDLKQCLEHFKYPIIYSDTGQEIPESSPCEYIFILDNFADHVFRQLYANGRRIMGPPVIIKCARDNLPLPKYGRPLYCMAMSELILCFTGIKQKEKMAKLTDTVHHMYGIVKKEISPKVTHLVANCCGNDKYRFSVNYGIPIMRIDWIMEVWEYRNDILSRADQEKYMCLRLKPFEFCYLGFYGFNEDDKKQMEELTSENGGTYLPADDSRCTHLVVDDHAISILPEIIKPNGFIVRAEWFWGSLQMDACAWEDIYLFEKKETPEKKIPLCLNNSSSKNRKRRLLQDINQCYNDSPQSPNWGPKRLSSDRNETSINVSRKFHEENNTSIRDEKNIDKKSGKLSRRCLVVMELLQTERNYVKILDTILNTFKKNIENPHQYNGPILTPLQVKSIFGKIPPIYDVHCQIRNELEEIVNNWREDIIIGNVILKHTDTLVKTYSPFISYFENTKECILECEKRNPRFHAFLKVSLNKPECGRQSLVELMIRPVQRLGSIILLLNEILKKTVKSNPDYQKIEEATKALKEVLTCINEGKKKTENGVEMFNLFNDIECCPANLLSSHRIFLKRVDVIELINSVSLKGDALSLFLFSDNLEICKRRAKSLSTSSKSPSSHKTPQKPFKHLTLLPLNNIKAVLDLNETQICQNAFGLCCNNGDKNVWYAFKIDGDTSKKEFQTLLCRTIADTLCRTDYERFLQTVDGEMLNADTRDLTWSRAHRIRKKVGRAFSFSKTPQLKRNTSGVTNSLSRFPKSHHQSTTSVVEHPFTGRRLASALDLSDIDSPLNNITEQTHSLGNDSDSISLDDYTTTEEDDHQKYSTLPTIGSTKLDYLKHPQNNTISKFTTLPSNRGCSEIEKRIYHV
ncbi:ECT2 [Acanthosepion pharaonis]|uniref:ECT2 n=1 Tax=Acanthosepion pharaonis TaxID=158019 RepID=A0A812CF40_ACAPH|nr:ECT2 [Sepia pharaonis]